MKIDMSSVPTENFIESAVRRLREITETAGSGIAEQANSVAKSRGVNRRDVVVTGLDVSKEYENWLRLGARRGQVPL